ncbi:hypothetical protein ACFVXQ_28090, partial [Kitasatospora sp. NPDC058263]
DALTVPTVDRRVVVDGRVEIAQSNTTNPAGAEEFEISYLLLPSAGVPADAVALEVSRLKDKGWKVSQEMGESASLLSPTGKTLATIVRAEVFLRNPADDRTIEPVLQKMGDKLRENPGAVVIALERVSR